MAKAKPTKKDVGQDNGAKNTTRKATQRTPKTKKVVGLGYFAGEGLSNEEHVARLRELEYDQTEPSEQTPGPQKQPSSIAQTRATKTELNEIEGSGKALKTSKAQSLPSTEGEECTKTDLKERTRENKSQEQDSDQQAPQSDQSTGEEGEGDDSIVVAETAEEYVINPLAHEETRARATNRWVLEGRRWETDNYRRDMIRQCRANGMSRDEARDHAWKACLAQFPPPGEDPSVIELPDPEPDLSTIVDTLEPIPTPIASDQGVPGLGTLPESWGILPANASLQVEISWVSANRLRVRDGSGVDLSKALSPAPSYSALSWLETSILFPSKFADISVKATANQDDEKEAIRREKLAIEDIRALLSEMLDG